MAALGVAGAYDRAITVFSPQGRLYQVEYALETVRAGSTAVAIACDKGVVLAVEERLHTKLQNPEFSWKLFQIDDHIGAAASGLNSDARILVDNARINAQIVRLSYDEPSTVETITKRVGDIMQMYTQHAGVRPFGAALLIGGVDRTGPRVFYAEPSGLVLEYDAWSIGRGADKVKEFMEKHYDRKMDLEKAIQLAAQALVHSVDKMDDGWTARVVTIPADVRKYTAFPNSDMEKHIQKAAAEKKGSGEK